ncbi:EST2-like protein [Saccharomyces kudriavzevii IFO 1802]|uniref:EST2-like protein n=1 Tax=Saccharomyces kudriavzevii (strain ATCC MYA-4449 / AS 2.2408 / CBS 8840 / NBRC 1802 / NCYC 2889) TaxID=226230 RepID=J8THD5_SACK1|nr:EST2-like protein [Saccharomyces kudriavzevii IFO 1802]
MKSLYEFIQDKLGTDFESNALKQDNFECGQFNGLDELLTTCFILPNSRKIALPSISGDLNHKSVVDQSIHLSFEWRFLQ